MSKARLYFGSSTGNTEYVAELIETELGELLDTAISIRNVRVGDLSSAGALILGSSTWENGELQEDWVDFWPDMDEVDLSGKIVALFGLGDAGGFSGEFVAALGILYDKVVERGATVVGFWPADGYDFQRSNALRDGRFVGLVIDEDNQPEMTEARVKEWCDLIRPALANPPAAPGEV